MEPVLQVCVQRLVKGVLESAQDFVAEEVPVALEYNGIPQVVSVSYQF